MNNPYKLNTWLDSTIENYINHFGASERPVVWEVGSRDGRDGVELATRIYTGAKEWFWTRATVVCIEPNPIQADYIRKKYTEAEVLQLAASNHRGEAPFRVYAGDEGAVGSSSLDLGWKGDDVPGHTITVKTDRLDHLIKHDEIDIMKIDVEGLSMEVLEGLGGKVRQVKVYHIETEVWTGSDVRVKEFMKKHNYLLVDESEQYSEMPDLVWVRQ